MKTCLVAVNASYTHTSLSVRCLKKAADTNDVCVKEYTINDEVYHVSDDIYRTGAEVYAFSCYIWNIEFVLKVCKTLKTINPNAKILLGGAEVSYDAVQVLENNAFVDFVLCGEGEIAFKQFVSGENLENISGLVFRKNGKTIEKPPCVIENLDILPRLYDEEELLSLENKIIYYETSRGCPYNCSFCLSSVSRGVRFFPLERVFEDFLMFDKCGIKLVKLVDRTFNTDERRTNDILKFILENIENTCFHFEISAHSLKQSTIELLKSAPKGKFQLEIGVQSTNEKTIKAINRTTNYAKLCENIKSLKENKNMHIHLDLIAGLAYEDLDSFKKSFNDVFALRPDMLQLGFLKLLKGASVRENASEHEYRFLPYPPYEVVSNKYINYEEISQLKRVCDMVDKFYNSSVFANSVEYALKKFETAYDFFFSLSQYYYSNGYANASQSRKKLYDIFYGFLPQDEKFASLLLFDFLKNNPGAALTQWTKQNDRYFAKRVSHFISEHRQVLCENLQGEKLSQILKNVRVHEFDKDVLKNCENKKTVVLFDYKNECEYEIFGLDDIEKEGQN